MEIETPQKNDIINSFLSASIGSPLLEKSSVIDLIEQLINKISVLYGVKLNMYFGSQFFEIGDVSRPPIDQQTKSIRFRDKRLGEVLLYCEDMLGRRDNEFIDVALAALAANWQSRWGLEVARTITQPVPFHGTEYEYNCTLAKIITDIFLCDHVFLRRKSGSQFECIGYAGSNNSTEFQDHRLDNRTYPEIHEFLHNVVISPSTSTPYHDAIFHVSEEEYKLTIASIRDVVKDQYISHVLVVPLVVGGMSQGIISLLFKDSNTANIVQDEMVSLIANYIAVAISHYEKANLLAYDRTERALLARSRVNFEIIQGLRHSAANNLASADMSFVRLREQFKKHIPQDENSHFYNLGVDINLLKHDLANMEKLVARPKDGISIAELANVADVFRGAASLLDKRMAIKHSKRKISVQVSGPALLCLCDQDVLNYAFVNIILNSIRAINDKNNKNNNEAIKFVGKEIGNRIQIDISDTGGGVPINVGTIQRVSDIWEPGRTSKPDGTGYGLIMVRDAIQKLNDGTIDVLENSPNLTLRIILPKYRAGEKDKYEQSIKKHKN